MFPLKKERRKTCDGQNSPGRLEVERLLEKNNVLSANGDLGQFLTLKNWRDFFWVRGNFMTLELRKMWGRLAILILLDLANRAHVN